MAAPVLVVLLLAQAAFADTQPVERAQNRGQLDKPMAEVSQNAFKKERRKLRKLSDAALQALAETGDRSAQMILAERFALEAETLAVIPIAANSAMADAAYWSSLAARRGYPGAAAADRAFPALPLRAHRR